jgi:hypothetical protein
MATFSDHLAVRGSWGFSSQQIPPPEVEGHQYEIESFRNDIPMTDFETPYPPDWPLKDTLTVPMVPSNDLEWKCRRALVQKLIVPTAIVTIPMALIAAGLLGLVFGYRVQSDQTLFPSPGDVSDLKDHTTVLVNFSASEYIQLHWWSG